MTPKEKAEQLFNKYLYLDDEYQGIEYAKKCSLICAKEIIMCTLPSCEFGGEINDFTSDYWQQVKIEIKEL